jgi:TonB family protein
MRLWNTILFTLLTCAALPVAARAADAEGCADLKLFPRLQGCAIVECAAKQHESFNTGDTSGPLDANVNSLTYSCPVSLDLERLKRELDAEIRKAGYLIVSEEKSDPATPAGTARKGSHWLRWDANSEDGASSYSLISAESAAEAFKTEACGRPPGLSSLKQCEVVECASKLEDSVAMRTAPKAETSLTGNVQTFNLACPALSAAQAFSTLEDELKVSGSEILFADREHPESGWMTGRAGKRWVELASAPEGESVSYALTVVPSAEVLTAAKPQPLPVVAATPVAAVAQVPAPTPKPTPAPTPQPVETVAMVPPQAVAPYAPTPQEQASPAIVAAPPPSNPVSPPVASLPRPDFIPPKPLIEVPIEATHERIYSVMGDIVINLLVDVSEDGKVTNAVLAGHITKDVLKLESAALEAVSHWRFEPARQDGRVVPAAKIAVQMRFRGRPWRY